MNLHLLSNLMATNTLQKEYREFPINFLVGFFNFCLKSLRDERKEFLSHTKPFYQMYEFTGEEENTVIIFEKQGEEYSLKFYLQKLRPPDFEKNYGFNGDYTNENLSVVTFASGQNELTVHLGEGKEQKLSLDPFVTDTDDTNPFEGTIKFNTWFWKGWKHVMEKEFQAVADK